MKSHNNPSRRSFIKQSLLVGSLLPLVNKNLQALPVTDHRQATRLKVNIFSKHLQFLNYQDMAEAAAEIGFDGVDLTVRPKGHVLPERVESDLPKAVEAIKKNTLASVMMTTAVENANNSIDQKLLETAAGLGIQYYRMNWLAYPEGKTIPDAVEQFKQSIKGLASLNNRLGLTGCYQNHSGDRAGASIWELWDMLQPADKQYMGAQYDIRHAVVEGGLSWKNGLRLIQTRIKTLAIKDFVWAQKDGKWVVENVPLGEGMVDFKTYFSLLKQYQIQVPVSLHFEYPLGGAEHGRTEISIDKREVFAAMKRDLAKLHEMWS
jgi:L-ribulose-5-phosphate 3-epimerase